MASTLQNNEACVHNTEIVGGGCMCHKFNAASTDQRRDADSLGGAKFAPTLRARVPPFGSPSIAEMKRAAALATATRQLGVLLCPLLLLLHHIRRNAISASMTAAS